MWINNSKSKHSILIMLIDAFLINISIIFAYLIRFNFTLPAENFQPYLQLFFWISLGSIFFLNIYHLYAISPRTRWDDQFYSIVMAVSLTLMLSISLTYISANYAFPRSVFLISWFLQLVFLILWRYFLWKTTKKALGIQSALIIGSLSDAMEIADRFVDFQESHMNIIGIITEKQGSADEQCHAGEPEDGLPGRTVCRHMILGEIEDFAEILAGTSCDIVIVAPSLEASLKESIVCYCYSMGKEVFLVPELYEVLLVKANLNLIDDIPVFTVQDSNGGANQVKRSLDLVIGLAAFVLTLPVMAVVALLVKLDSPGPVIYKQERVTKGGRLFTLYKFRTMIQDAEESTGPVFAVEDDQRATRIGRFLRLSRLDELPQLINVIKGDMSLVGPRPERPFFVERYEKEIEGYTHRHRIKPGITGIAQIAGKYNTGPREKLVFDLLYAKKNDVLVDLQILLHTVKVLFMRNKAS